MGEDGAQDPGHGHRRLCFSPQEPCDRLLLLYPNSLAIFSEEPDGLCFKVRRPRVAHGGGDASGWVGQRVRRNLSVNLSVAASAAASPNSPRCTGCSGAPSPGAEGARLGGASL